MQVTKRTARRLRRKAEGKGSQLTKKPPRAANVRLVEESEATGVIKRIYDDIKATRQIDFVPNFWKALAHYPPLLEQTWTRLKAVMTPGKLDALTKEMIALAVSAANGCRYCINSHSAAVQKLGLDEQGLGELMAVVGMFSMTNALADAYQVEPDVRPQVAGERPV